MGNYNFDGYGGPLSWTAGYPVEDWCILSDLVSAENLPNKFDLREVGGVSPVKDKGRTPEGIGICWLFSAIASLESNLLYTKKTSPKDDPLYIQSELHGAYATFDVSEGDKECENPAGIRPKKEGDKNYLYGGTRCMAVNYLTKGTGTTPWLLDPYYKEDMVGQTLKKRRWDITTQKPGKYYVKEVRFLPDPMPSGKDSNYLLLVKNHVIRYGGVSCTIFWTKDNMYVKKLTNGEYTYHDNTSGNKANHGVTIVGWDDDYPVDNFRFQPKKPGAFLVKNCWGSSPAGGYVWVSYECANFGGRAFCVANVETDYYNDSVKVYQNDDYGYNDAYVPYSDGSRRTAKAKNTFGAVPKDKLIGVSFYVCSACYVTLKYSDDVTGEVKEIVKNYLCPMPGYYTYDMTQSIAINNTSFSVIVEYTSATNLPAFIPLEVNDDDERFIHWHIDGSKSSVYRTDVGDEGTWVPVSDLGGPTSNSKYGYFCMKAIVKNFSDEAWAVKEVYGNLPAPAVYDGYTEILPQIWPAKSMNVPLAWRLEPYRASDYSITYQNPISMFEIENAGQRSYGLVNTGTEKASAYLVATIDSKGSIMRKIFNIEIGPPCEMYTFTCGEVEEHSNKCTIWGEFRIPGAKVTVTANGQTGTTTVKQDGTWVLEYFSLYSDETGWMEDYANTTVKAEIKSSNGLLLTRGACYLHVENPAEKVDDGYNVFTPIGLITAVLALGLTAGVVHVCCNMEVPAGTAAGAAGAAAFPGGPGIAFAGEDAGEIVLIGLPDEVPLLAEAASVRNLGVRYIGNIAGQKKTAESQQWGGIAKKISKGGSITNCSVSGSISNLRQFGGLFYEGEDVTVQGCTVDLEVDSDSGSYAGVAVELSGSNSSITDTTVTGSVKADKVAGLVQTMGGGCIKDSGVSLNAQAKTSFAGILESGDGVEISNTVVAVTGSASEGKAAGAALSMKDGSVKNCRISAVLSGAAGAFGVAGAMEGKAKIENCYSACALTATRAGAAVCGIAGGIENSPDSISGCVSVGSHFSAPQAARVSLYPGNNCVAYDSIICDKSFVSAGELLKPSSEFYAKSLYDALKWDFSVWGMEEKEGFPFIQGGKIPQVYDYPFLYPQPPESGKFEYAVGQVVAIMGVKNTRMKQLIWSLSPHLDTTKVASGDYVFMENNNDFYVQIAALPNAGDYDLTLTSILDGHKYDTVILLHII